MLLVPVLSSATGVGRPPPSVPSEIPAPDDHQVVIAAARHEPLVGARAVDAGDQRRRAPQLAARRRPRDLVDVEPGSGDGLREEQRLIVGRESRRLLGRPGGRERQLGRGAELALQIGARRIEQILAAAIGGIDDREHELEARVAQRAVILGERRAGRGRDLLRRAPRTEHLGIGGGIDQDRTIAGTIGCGSITSDVRAAPSADEHRQPRDRRTAHDAIIAQPTMAPEVIDVG